MRPVAFDYWLMPAEGPSLDLRVTARVDRAGVAEVTSVRVLATGEPYEPDEETRRCLELDAVDVAEEQEWRVRG